MQNNQPMIKNRTKFEIIIEMIKIFRFALKIPQCRKGKFKPKFVRKVPIY